MKKTKKQFELPVNELSLSLLIGIEGERYLNINCEKRSEPDLLMDSSLPFWKRTLLKLFQPPSPY